jgi:Protein of unknown function (DUF2934)
MAKRTIRSSSTTNSKTQPEPLAEQAADMGAPETRASSMGSEPSEEEIRMRAYRRYLERGGGDGQDFDDWLEAEKELKRRG